jgi:hypothetical protein
MCLISACVSMSALSDGSEWKITEVPGKDKSIVGYIYHVGAVGTQITPKVEKVTTSLRFVCSTRTANQKDNDPLIILFWNTMTGNKSQIVEVKADKKIIGEPLKWDQEGSVLMRSVAESKELIQTMKTNKDVNFRWYGSDGVQHITTFDLRTFNSRLGEFNTLCKTEL